MFQKTLTRGGRYNKSNYPVQELWLKRDWGGGGGGGGAIFEGGVLAGHYDRGLGVCVEKWD